MMSLITLDDGNSFEFPWPSSWPSYPAPRKVPEPAAPSIGRPLGLLVREPDINLPGLLLLGLSKEREFRSCIESNYENQVSCKE